MLEPLILISFSFNFGFWESYIKFPQNIPTYTHTHIGIGNSVLLQHPGLPYCIFSIVSHLSKCDSICLFTCLYPSHLVLHYLGQEPCVSFCHCSLSSINIHFLNETVTGKKNTLFSNNYGKLQVIKTLNRTLTYKIVHFESLTHDIYYLTTDTVFKKHSLKPYYVIPT